MAFGVSSPARGELGGADAVDGGQAGRDEGDRLDARGPLRGEQGGDARPLVRLHVEEERRRRVRREVGRELAREVPLDEGQVDDDEGAEAEGEDRPDGAGAGPPERREAVTEREGEPVARQERHGPEEPAGGEGEDERRGGEDRGEEEGHPGHSRLDPGRRRDAAEEEGEGEEPRSARGRDRLGLAPEDARRRDAADGQERGQGEQERDADAEAEAAQERSRLPRVEPSGREEVGVRVPDDGHEGEAGGGAEEAPEEPEPRRLDAVEEQGLARRDAETAEDGERVEAAGDPGPHRLRDADTADEQGRQGDEPEKAGGPPHGLPELRLTVEPALDANARDPLELRLQRLRASSGRGNAGPLREVQEEPPPDAAPEARQRRAREPPARDEDPRAEAEGAGEPVRFGDDRPRDAEPDAAEGDLAADPHPEPPEDVGVCDDGVGSEQLPEGPGRLDAELSGERVGHLDRLQLDEEAPRGGPARGGGRARLEEDGDELLGPRPRAGDRGHRGLDGGREGPERLHGEVGPEEGARLRPDRLLEGRRQPRDGDHGGDAGPEADREEREPRARPAALPRELAEEGAGVHGAASSRSTLPSRRWTRRPARAATAGSCVTRTSVVPCSSWSRTRTSRIEAPVALSRFPVGSSARRRGGRGPKALASATRCCSPPESWEG